MNAGSFVALVQVLSMTLQVRLVLLATLLIASTTHAGEPIEIGSRRELFVDGFLVDETRESLAAALIRLASEADERKTLAEAARAGAVERFAFTRFAGELRDLYEELCG